MATVTPLKSDDVVTDGVDVNGASDELQRFLSRKYDFVIVGGGTAGLTMAARLSEDPRVQVAVLEAGESRRNDPKILTPGFVGTMTGDQDYDWQFKTVPQASDALHDA